MRNKFVPSACLMVAAAFATASCLASEPIIPPNISQLRPAGMERGRTAVFLIQGRNLSATAQVIFDAPGLSGKLSDITVLPEPVREASEGQNTRATVPLGTRQQAKLAITAAPDVPPGLHRFRIGTSLGTTNTASFAVGTLPEVAENASGPATATATRLPATLVGTILALGRPDRYEFAGQAGEDVVFRTQASQFGSKLESVLTLRDGTGRVLATAGKNDIAADAVLYYKLPREGRYTLAVGDRDERAGPDYFYRVDAGALPYVSGFFPLGGQGGTEATFAVQGVNLGGARTVRVNLPKAAGGWQTAPLIVDRSSGAALDKTRIAVGDTPEVLEREPNNSASEAQTIAFPVTINGHIHNAKAGGSPDEDYFRFHAQKGEKLDIEVAAARLGSPLDSVIEVLDAQGKQIHRATVRCLNETTTTLSDRDSRTVGIRLTSTSGLKEEDYLMIGDELDRIAYIPDQPDADTMLQGIGGLRHAYEGTSPDVHAVNTPVYKAQILPPDASFPSNGLPVFHLTWRNDDGGPGYGADSQMNFVAPADGEYLLRIGDVRGLQGADFAYRLIVRPASPDFQIQATPGNSDIPQGGSTMMTVSVVQRRGEVGPIRVEVKGLPAGVTAGPATIMPGQNSTELVLTASAASRLDSPPSAIQVLGHAVVDGHDLERVANKTADMESPLQLASVIPPPDVVVTTDPQEISLMPGKSVTVTLHVDRRNGFKGRVPCFVRNLPPGVRVVNVGLNGVLVTESQSSRTFTLRAEDWAQPIEQPIYVVGTVESSSPTVHPSPPLQLKVLANQQTAKAEAPAAK